ncbi:hypothetical protein MMC26_005429 [Xylographa opegraphella]|nr:hypothetical protein [Xylographa opegraphella]
MSPSNDRSDADKSSAEDNPFIIFRRYADEQVANLLQSFIGLPSAIASQSFNQRWQPYDDEIQRRRMERRDASLEEKERRQIVDQIEGAFRDSLRNETETQMRPDDEEANIPVKVFRRQDPHVQAEEDVSRCPYRPSERSSLAIANPYETFFPWPFNYMLFSSYSPLKLERQEHFRDHGDWWRNAFEDLLSMDNETGTSTQRKLPSEGTDSSSAVPEDSGLESHLAKLFRASVEHKRYFNRSADEFASREPQNDASQESMTELDYYERLLEPQRTDREKQPSALMSIARPTSASEVSPTNGTGEESKKPGIVSTLTTTERVSLPDGTVHTKVMLKQRFANGREESSETVHTTQGGPQPERQPNSFSDHARDSKEPPLAQPDAGKQRFEKKGWFWS